ncbi:MAG: TIM barrel protein [Christensenellaceae bacterium]|jgi:deoxyribonuclease-4|nr:TIM barrel protein [Christensenellaceae bacterium]
MIRFGPSGNDEKFYADGNKSSVDAPRWLAGLELSAYEISFGLGIRMTDKTAQIIGEQAKKYGIQISVHAPYYINLANPDPVAIEKSYHYIKRSLEILHIMGGERLVVHIGSQMELERNIALQNCRKNLEIVIQRLDKDGINNFLLCIETMGKYRQIGNVDEICDLCSVDERVIPTFDFGHINCLMQGQMNVPEIFEIAERKLGLEKLKKLHLHLSYIRFGQKGEIEHTTLADDEWGFEIDPILNEIIRRDLSPTIICESANIMAQDAVKIMQKYKKIVWKKIDN